MQPFTTHLPKPNYTQISNIILDEWAPRLGNAELRVVLAIARRTIGWHVAEAPLSINYLCLKTGLTSRSVRLATAGLINLGLITKTTHNTADLNESSTYSLNISTEEGGRVFSTLGGRVFSTPIKERNTKEREREAGTEKEEKEARSRCAPTHQEGTLEIDERNCHGEIVKLTPNEYGELASEFGKELLEAKILRMNVSQAEKPPSKRYKRKDSHYKLLKAWLTEDRQRVDSRANAPLLNMQHAKKRALELKEHIRIKAFEKHAEVERKVRYGNSYDCKSFDYKDSTFKELFESHVTYILGNL